MKRALAFTATVAVMLTGGCRQAVRPVDPIAGAHLTETVLGRTLIQNALTLSNSWIDPAAGVRFAPSWSGTVTANARDIVPVYAISAMNAPANYMVAVPARCRCVFVQPRAYEDWLARHLTHGGITLEVDPTRLLAFMLLHEAGHLVHHDPGEFDGSGTGSLNADMNAEKTREEAADDFAVQQLKQALQRTKEVTPWLDAQRVTMDLGNLGFETLHLREQQHFGSDSLGSPEAFLDTGYTHPNFELRLLTVNDKISNTPTSHNLLESFLAKRDPHNPVLYNVPTL